MSSQESTPQGSFAGGIQLCEGQDLADSYHAISRYTATRLCMVLLVGTLDRGETEP
jgi:hypothetical protein